MTALKTLTPIKRFVGFSDVIQHEYIAVEDGGAISASFLRRSFWML